ncbi:MAG: Proline--tRNA ligase [Candidatus Anoxychlamydiales bacterium]|nr:Proline--tRNA ligase [Candidatus Anoxychlamydiales bacterium]NGX36477.1 Proline--tRNA ligase [Candidatus Anoxychlamydiales bacterium]
MSKKSAITPTRDEDYASWYQEVVKAADLAEHAPVRGCMVIKPWGYGLWENIQRILDKKIKDTGHKNAYFPLFVPLSFLQKEASHVEGFAKECAVVTHHRLEMVNGKLEPAKDSKLEEPLIVRPTSETIIGEMFSKWIKSYRDLPLLINQWANIVRWEMRTRLFLRTTEFLWQEGHTAHRTKKEAEVEVFKMLGEYKDFLENYLAIPCFMGRKSEMEKFPGAVDTYALETMMQDKKALQACTSHFLGQNFSKASDIKFNDENGKVEYAWTTSWGLTTRVIGALVMVHSDDDGFIIPPKVAPSQIVIIPVVHSDEVKDKIIKVCEKLKEDLEKVVYHNKNIVVEIDTRDLRGGEKKWSWIKKGVPIILEIGPKDIEKESVFMMRRNTLEKNSIKTGDFVKNITKILDDIQDQMYEKAKRHLDENTKEIFEKDEFYKFFTPKNIEKPEIHAGFAKVYFCLDRNQEEKIKEDLSVSVRCIIEDEKEEKKCIFCSKKTKSKVIFAKAY